MTTGALALLIFAAIFAQIAVLLLVWLYRRGRQNRGSEPQAASPQAPDVLPGQLPPSSGMAWEGFREFRVERRVFEDRGGSICSFYLVPVDGAPLPAFRPGQFLTFRLPVEDPVSHVPGNLVRCYSLSDRPRPDYYRISVKRVPPPAGSPELPPGRASGFLHDQVHEGSSLMIKAPAGHFHLVEDEPLPLVLIAGGIGITPMLSIINTLLQDGSARELWLYYGVRDGNEQIMQRHLKALAAAHANFHLHLCYSKPLASEVEGVDYQHRGRVDIPLLRATLKLMRYQFYVCGPKAMMESLVPGLEEWGVDTRDIHYESFGPATLVRHAQPALAPEATPGPPVTITFSHSGRRVAWNPAAGSLLAFAEEQGIAVESGCRAGSCGSCQTALEAGEVDYSQQPDADIEPGHCLLCISTPKTDLTLAV